MIRPDRGSCGHRRELLASQNRMLVASCCVLVAAYSYPVLVLVPRARAACSYPVLVLVQRARAACSCRVLVPRAACSCHVLVRPPAAGTSRMSTRAPRTSDAVEALLPVAPTRPIPRSR
ncbi:MAG: hypothetical protein IPQ07_36030 [Myxococcales bacterium]|nr:hypothetical protein [Myxococcales bacterium]